MTNLEKLQIIHTTLSYIPQAIDHAKAILSKLPKHDIKGIILNEKLIKLRKLQNQLIYEAKQLDLEIIKELNNPTVNNINIILKDIYETNR